MQRNIVQGVNVVRRASYTLDGLLGARPSYEDMVASKRLPSDYIDKAFPAKSENSKAPQAERIERVSLQRLLPASHGPSAHRTQNMRPWPDNAPNAAGVSSSLPANAPASASGGPAQAAAPQPGQLTAMDPAMLAAMVVQVAMMQGQGGQGSAPPPMQGYGLPQSMAAPHMLSPTAQPAWLPQQQSAAASASTAAAKLPGIPSLAATQATEQLSGSAQTAAAVGATKAQRPAPASAQRPEVAAKTEATPKAAVAPPRPPFVRLLDEFCEKALAKEAAAPAASVH